MFESPVRSGFWPLRPKTGTRTGPTKFECSKRPDPCRTGPVQNRGPDWSRPVGNRSGPVIHYKNIIYIVLLNIIYILLNNKYTN